MEPQAAGPAAGVRIDFDALRKGYYQAMGWDAETGRPDRQTLKDLGLDRLVREL
jgi:aldehyde:ferredoxin oxidoreductase